MCRLLSQALIIILLLLGPITFSSASIPNFQPDCESGSTQRINVTVGIEVISRIQHLVSTTLSPLYPQFFGNYAAAPFLSRSILPYYSRPPPFSLLPA